MRPPWHKHPASHTDALRTMFTVVQKRRPTLESTAAVQHAWCPSQHRSNARLTLARPTKAGMALSLPHGQWTLSLGSPAMALELTRGPGSDARIAALATGLAGYTPQLQTTSTDCTCEQCIPGLQPSATASRRLLPTHTAVLCAAAGLQT
jgi:hypothetical protein